MKFSIKRTFALLALPAAVLLLSGCGKQAATNSEPTAQKAAQNAPEAKVATSPDATQAAQQAPALEPLPADNKQAIDQELSNIDKDLKATDGTVSSTDLSNVNLGI